MKHLLIGTVAAVFSLASAPLSAQSANSASNSGSSSSNWSSNQSGAQASIYMDQRSSGTTSTLKTAPPVTAPSMGSGHPCGLGSSAGISIIGGGISGGNSRVDEACLLAQMGQGEAALIMIAARSGEACRALRQVNRISANSVCKGDKVAKKPSYTTRPVARPTPYNKCVKNSEGAIVFRRASGYSSADAKAACLKKMGYGQ